MEKGKNELKMGWMRRRRGRSGRARGQGTVTGDGDSDDDAEKVMMHGQPGQAGPPCHLVSPPRASPVTPCHLLRLISPPPHRWGHLGATRVTGAILCLPVPLPDCPRATAANSCHRPPRSLPGTCSPLHPAAVHPCTPLLHTPLRRTAAPHYCAPPHPTAAPHRCTTAPHCSTPCAPLLHPTAPPSRTLLLHSLHPSTAYPPHPIAAPPAPLPAPPWPRSRLRVQWGAVGRSGAQVAGTYGVPRALRPGGRWGLWAPAGAGARAGPGGPPQPPRPGPAPRTAATRTR